MATDDNIVLVYYKRDFELEFGDVLTYNINVVILMDLGIVLIEFQIWNLALYKVQLIPHRFFSGGHAPSIRVNSFKV